MAGIFIVPAEKAQDVRWEEVGQKKRTPFLVVRDRSKQKVNHNPSQLLLEDNT